MERTRNEMNLDEMLDRYMTSEEFEFIPSVGRKVYVVSVSGKEITEETVYALGRETFLIDRDYSERRWREFRYDDYFKRWFLTLATAKKFVEQYLTEDEELEGEGWNGVWMVKPL